MDPNSAELLQSKRFSTHAAHFVSMIDTTVNMLGPDIEMLTEIMLELGAKHVRYGVTPQMFPIMGQCLLQTIEECLTMETEHGSSFRYTQEMRDSWVEVYLALSNDMIRSRHNSK
jgi:hemoglobin-like flavoprotein